MKKRGILLAVMAAGLVSLSVSACGESGGTTASQTAGAAVSVQDFAAQVQKAVAAQDLQALSDLCAYPVYVGIGEGQVIENRDQLLALNPQEVFSEALRQAIANVDIQSLSPVQAGYVMGAESGTPNVIFSEQSGRFVITGINEGA